MIIVLGITKDNKIFRPSDWTERLSSLKGNWNNGVFRFSKYVFPGIKNNIKCLYIDESLLNIDDKIYHFLLNFAKNNKLEFENLK